MAEQYDKSTVLARARAGRAEFEAKLAHFDESEMTISRPPMGWSVKDLMAHITFWEDYALQRFAEALRGETPRLLGQVTEQEINRVNQEALDAGRAKSLEVVRSEFTQVYAALIAQVEALPDDPADPFWSLWPEPDMPWKLVHWNTYGHYAEHAEMLHAWIES